MRINALLAGFLLAAAPLASSAQISVTAPPASPKVIRAEVAASTGLEAVYVVRNLNDITAKYTARGDASGVKWYRFGSQGGAYSEEITQGVGVQGSVTSIQITEAAGYIADDNGKQTCFWVIDYSENPLQLNALVNLPEEADCGRSVLQLDGSAAPLEYYSITGRHMELSRELQVEYNTLEFDKESFAWQSAEKSVTETSLPNGRLSLPAPLCRTVVYLSGDRFLTQWGEAQQVESDEIQPVAVECRTEALQTPVEADNLSGGTVETGELGGNAPAEIAFVASVTDAAIFTEWQFSPHSDFEDISLRINESSYTHTFTEQGITYVRFICSNASGDCSSEGDVYTVSIGNSSLLCPNAFSPGASEGVNDIWKVSYRSIISFDCHIYNRWGKELYHYSDPAGGWDGKSGGKVVPAGVYFYVIKATGADGREYNLRGDINIVNYK